MGTAVTYREPFSKSIGTFDRIEIKSVGSDWLTLSQHVGNDARIVDMVFRSDEAVRDLHYAISAYLAHINKETK